MEQFQDFGTTQREYIFKSRFTMIRSFLFHFIFVSAFLVPAAAEEAWQVTSKAWDALAAEDWGAVESLANRATRTWGANAKKTNDGLSKFPSADEAKGFATLNELATVIFLKGEALRKKAIRTAL